MPKIVFSSNYNVDSITERNSFSMDTTRDNTNGLSGIEIMYKFSGYVHYSFRDFMRSPDSVRETLCLEKELVVICWRTCLSQWLLGLSYGEKRNQIMIEIIKTRIKKKLPVAVIYDRSHEGEYSKEDLNKKIQFFSQLGLDVKKDVLFIVESSQFRSINTQCDFPELKAQNYNILSYHWPVVDSFIWKNHRPNKFTQLPLIKRPNLVNLMVSKIPQKGWRAWTVYQFYKQDLLKQTIMSIAGTPEEFSQHIDDTEFLKEIKERYVFIGGGIFPVSKLEGEFQGHTNIENGAETSNRIIFTNSRLSCVLETIGCDIYKDQDESFASRITEKVYRSIANCTPYVVISTPQIYDIIKDKGYHTFDNILDGGITESYKEKNCKKRISKITDKIKKFLEVMPYKIDTIQGMVNENYQNFESSAKNNLYFYKKIVDNFLGKYNMGQQNKQAL